MSSTNLRAAAFLAEQQRIDFRRTGGSGGKVRCKPPNRACGNRCIPPSWDCRLRGEGNDPHLKAAGRGTDIVSGFANLQRGLTGIGKGISKLNFSEVETGRRALARGTAKLHPGDLKKKEEAKKAVYNTALWVLTPVVLGITAALGHKGLKSFRIYREGVGRDIDNTFREVTDKIARNTPFGVGEGIRAREAAGRRGLESVRRSQQGIAETLRSRTTTGTRTLQVVSSRRSAGDGQRTIQTALDQVNRTPGVTSNYLGVEEWYDRSLKTFWSVKRRKPLQDIAKVGEGSLYSIDSANTLLARSLGLRDSNNQPLNLRGADLEAEASQVRNLIASRIKAERENIAIGMRQAQLDPKDATSVQQYLQSTQSDWQTGDVAVDEEISRTIVNMMSGKIADSSIADEMYRRTVNKFDVYYDDIRDLVTNPPGIGSGLTRRRQLYQDAVRGHTQYLARSIDFGFEVNGPGMTALLKKAYHKRRVQTKNGRTARNLSLTGTELANVATELGIDIRTKQAPELEALINKRMSELVPLPDKPNAEPLITVRRIQAPAEEARAKAPKPAAAPEPDATSSAPTPPSGAAGTRPARRYRANEQQIVQRLIKAGYSEEAARAKAAQYIAERAAREAARKTQDAPEREDALDTWTARDDAHLETWIRLDKRCGKSGIPQNRKCSKPTGAQSEEARLREQGARDPGPTCRPGMQLCGKICIPQNATCRIKGGAPSNLGSNLAKGALAAGVVAGAVLGGRHAFRTRHSNQLYRSSANHISKGIQAMSSKNVRSGIARLPKQWQDPANKLVGKAKMGLAYVAADAQGLKIKHIDTKNNFSTWHNEQTGHVLSIGAVDDTLVTFVSERKGKAGAFDKYGVAFQTDLSFAQKEGLSKAQGLAVSSQVKTMFQNQLDQLPENAVLFNKPFKDDGLGDKRSVIYKRFQFRELPGLRGGELYALKNQGKLTKIPDEQVDYITELIRGGNTQAARTRYNNRRRDAKDSHLPTRVATYLVTSKALYEPA